MVAVVEPDANNFAGPHDRAPEPHARIDARRFRCVSVLPLLQLRKTVAAEEGLVVIAAKAGCVDARAIRELKSRFFIAWCAKSYEFHRLRQILILSCARAAASGRRTIEHRAKRERKKVSSAFHRFHDLKITQDVGYRTRVLLVSNASERRSATERTALTFLLFRAGLLPARHKITHGIAIFRRSRRFERYKRIHGSTPSRRIS